MGRRGFYLAEVVAVVLAGAVLAEVARRIRRQEDAVAVLFFV